MTSQRYTIEIVADAPPRLCLGDVLAGGQIVGIKSANDEPGHVGAKWLANYTGLSVSTITRKCASLNIGTDGKHSYPREQALALLNQRAARRGRPRAS